VGAEQPTALPGAAWIEAHIHAFEVGSALALVRPGCEKIWLLNDTAKAIWQRLVRAERAEEITRALAEQFGTGPEILRSDIQTTLKQWAAEGLLPGLRTPAITPSAVAPERDSGDGTQATAEVFITVNMAGKVVDIGVAPQSLQPRVLHLMGHLTCPTTRSTDDHLVLSQHNDQWYLRHNGALIGRYGSTDEGLIGLRNQLIALGLRELDTLVTLHGAAATLNGQCVVFPAPGSSGKSSLAYALGHAGWSVLAEDVTPVLRKSRQVLPFPTSFKFRRPSLAVLQEFTGGPVEHILFTSGGEEQFHAPAFPVTEPLTKHPVHAMVFPRYVAGARLAWRPLSLQECLLKLLESGSAITADDIELKFPELLDWLEQTPAYEMIFDALAPALQWLESLSILPRVVHNDGGGNTFRGWEPCAKG
jgi:hypothetical protein